MFPTARTVLTIRGIAVRLDRSWILIAALIVFSFQGRWSSEFGGATALVMAVGGAGLFFVSLLAHELGHALEARHRGIGVGGITLFLLGGVTEMQDDAKRPRDEFAIAAVGPFISLVTGALFGLLATMADLLLDAPALEHTLGLVGWLNVGLALFNLLPASPLDGGRVLRSMAWAVTGSRRKGIVVSARAGQLLALLVGLLVIQALTNGNLLSAMVNALVAWFLWSASQAELRHAALDRLLEGEHAGALDVVASERIDAETSLAVVSAELEAHSMLGARPVVGPGGEVVGALVLSDVTDMHPHDQTFRVARDIMRPVADLPKISSGTSVWDLLETFQREPLVLLDLDDGRTTTLTARQFAEALEGLRRRRRGLPAAPEAARL